MKEMLSVYILNNFKSATVTDILHSRCMAIAVVMETIKTHRALPYGCVL